jgi:hypothetical protein
VEGVAGAENVKTKKGVYFDKLGAAGRLKSDMGHNEAGFDPRLKPESNLSGWMQLGRIPEGSRLKQ